MFYTILSRYLFKSSAAKVSFSSCVLSRIGRTISAMTVDTSDGITVTGSYIDIFTISIPWEGELVRSPNVFKRNGMYYMIYGTDGKSSSTKDYGSIGIARSSSILGPYTKMPGPLLSNFANNSKSASRPGQPTLFTTPDGSMYMLYVATPVGSKETKIFMHYG